MGQDQVPHIELTRKIVRRFNELYAPVLIEPKALVGECSRLVGLDGNSKMSKSLNNAIYLSDSAETIEKKVRSAITDPARIHPTDPGHPDICTIFSYQQVFNQDEVAEIEEVCKAGRIGCVACKKKLAAVIDSLLEPMRERRKKWEKEPGLIDQILIDGTKRARAVAQETMDQVKEVMHLDYFEQRL